MKTLIDLFKLFEKRRNKVFVYRTGIRRFTFTYVDLYGFSLSMSQYLFGQGVKKGDRVAIWAPNSPYWAFCYFGILLAGGIVVPIDFASGKTRAETIVKLSGAKFIIQSNYKFEKLNPNPSTSSGLKTVMIEDLPFLLKAFNPIKKIIQVKPTEVCEIVYTSGTTGDPKGVVLTHKNIVSNILAATSHISLPRGFRFLSVLPLSHMFEQTVGFLSPLFKGDKIFFLRAIKPSSILEALREENINVMVVVPRILSLLKAIVERELASKKIGGLLHLSLTKKIISILIHKKFGGNFQMFFSGGAALPLDVFFFWKDLGFKIIEGYGLTECSPIVSANTFETQIPGSVGKPLIGVKVKIDMTELLVKGENVFSDYYQNPQETEKAFKNGWFKTGDIVEQDREGNIFIKGRKKDVIVNSSGVNIYPQDLEYVLNRIDGVKDSCVLGLDKGGGEKVHAVLLLREKDVKASEVVGLANEKLDPLAQIEGFSVWQDLDFPRTTTLKIQKFKVKERILSQDKKEGKTSEDMLISLIGNVSKKPVLEIKEDSSLTSDLGIDSLGRLELINYLEQEYRVDLEDTIINQKTTVSDIRKFLEKRERLRKQKGLWFWTNNRLGRSIREFLDIFFHKPLSSGFFDLESRGLLNLKNLKGPVVFISNHVSYLDQPAIMFSLPRDLRYKTATATREEFFFNEKSLPYGRQDVSMSQRILFPYTIIAFNAFLLPQKAGFRKSLAFMGKLIDHGVSILIFPEGTRSRNGKLQDFMSGLGLLVKELQVPVVPIRILGMEKIYPRSSKFPKKGKCIVVFGKPIEFTTESPSEIIEISRKAVMSL